MIRKVDHATLIIDIAKRAFTARQLARRYDCTIDELRAFKEDNLEAIKEENTKLVRQQLAKAKRVQQRLDQLAKLEELLTPENEDSELTLGDLWITHKVERVKRLQYVVERMLLDFSLESTLLREIRTYMNDVAEELGHIPNRGSNIDEETQGKVLYEIDGVDLRQLK
jgi:hypothetical protein